MARSPKLQNLLPASLPPRGLSRVQSAEYIGVGATLFDEMVAMGECRLPSGSMGASCGTGSSLTGHSICYPMPTAAPMMRGVGALHDGH